MRVHYKAPGWIFLFPFSVILIGCPSIQIPTNTTCVPANDASLGISRYPQQTSMWCWAASSEMCMEFLGSGDIRQCEEANKNVSRNDCCRSIVPDECINGGWPRFGDHGFAFSRTTNTPLSWNEIKKQIHCLRKPIAFSWFYNLDDGGHMMVITGYSTTGDQRWVNVNDPSPSSDRVYVISYEEYVSGSDHEHWNDYYNITKN